MAEVLNRSLQENLITILAYDKEQGKLVSRMLELNLLEGDYRLIAERCIDYWRQYDEPPGDHLADLFADILDDPHNRRAKVITRFIKNMIALSETINTKYVMNQLRDFNRLQRFKSALVESAEKINANEHMALPEIEEIWHALLRKQEVDFNAGMRLNEVARVLARLEELATEFRMGISELDRRGIVPARGKLVILGGAAGRGKTWGLVHIGKNALLDRKKVLHISCEIDEEEVLGRYYQSIFKIAKRPGDIEVTTLEKDIDALEGFTRKKYDPGYSLSSGSAPLELQTHIDHLGKRGENLVVKRFKPYELTGNGLRSYLDTLANSDGFVPDMIIMDYLGLMKMQDPKDKRGSIGYNCVDLRAIAIERNAAMVTAHQLSKKGEMAAMAKGVHMAEDWSIMGTADVAIMYSATDLEFRYGLARLYVAKSRTEEDRFAILITQSYKIGQFCLESMYLQKQYTDLFKDFTADSDDYEADQEEDEEDGEDD